MGTATAGTPASALCYLNVTPSLRTRRPQWDMYRADAMDTQMLTREQTTGGHTRRATVTRAEGGWLFREEDDTRLVRQVTYTDWHRVERALRTFEAVPADAGYSAKR